MAFKKAEKKGIRGRIAICGPSGSGKTMWSLILASIFAGQYKTKIAFVDTEQGSAVKYADLFEFDVQELFDDFGPQRYVAAMKEAADAGYGVITLDSITHAWAGTGGLLDQNYETAKKMRNANSYAAWRETTPKHNEFIEAMLAYPGHLIATMRTKTEYVQSEDDRGKKQIQKVGMAPIQRDGMEYEFDMVFDVNMEHELIVGKTRCKTIADKVYKPTDADAKKLAKAIITWLGDQATVVDRGMPQPERETILQRIDTGLQKLFADPAEAAVYCENKIGKLDPNKMTDDELAALFECIKADYKAKQKEASDAA